MKIFQPKWAGVWLFLAAANISAQDCHLALRGRISENEGREPLAYASVFVKEAQKGVLTNENGEFSIPNLCEGTIYTVSVSHVECEHATQIIRLTENARLDFTLFHHHALKEIVVVEKAVAPKAAQAEVVAGKVDLEAGKGQNLAETLRNLPGLSVLSTGASIGKPVIQGLHSNRIAIINNGTALEAQQWGSEHAPEIDPFSASKISVIKGAAGVRFGPGALGGAVVLEPEPFRTLPGVGGWVSLGGFSNGLGGVASGGADWRLKHNPLVIRLQGTLKRLGNLRTPDYFLQNSGLAEGNILLMAELKFPNWRHEFSASQFNQKPGILRAAHISNLTDLKAAIESDLPLNNQDEFTWKIARPYQKIQHNLLKYRALYRISEKWKFNSTYAFQFNNRREFDAHPPLSDPKDLLKKPQISFRIWSNTLDLALEHFPIRHWEGAVGVQAIQQLNYVGKGGLIPDFLNLGGSVWATERWRRYPNPWEFDLGIRYDFRQIRVTDTLGSLRKLDETLRFGNISASGGLIHHFSERLSTIFNSSLAWRPPHVNELFARGIHHGAATFEEGTPGLKPEKAWNSNFSIELKGRPVNFQATVFTNQIRDFIYLNPENELVLTARGAFPKYAYRQSNAQLNGLDGQAEWFFAKNFNAEARFSMVRGSRFAKDSLPDGSFETRRDWLPLMPGDRFSLGGRWSFRRQKTIFREGKSADGCEHGVSELIENESFVRVLATMVSRQTRIPEEGLLKAAPASFTVFSLDAGHEFLWKGKNFSLILSAQNLFNQRYREYLNFFRLFADEPGFGVSVRGKMTF